MANFDIYFPIENELEGVKFENVPGDSGGATKFGEVVNDLKKYGLDENGDGVIDWKDVRDLTVVDAAKVLKKIYWDIFDADNIQNQSLAMFIVDGALNQGIPTIVRFCQQILLLHVDGIIGKDTREAIHSSDPENLFNQLFSLRNKKYHGIVSANPSQQKFLNGWMNRLNAIKFQS